MKYTTFLVIALVTATIKCNEQDNVEVYASESSTGCGQTKKHDAQVTFCESNRYRTFCPEKCILENEINTQINMELRAFYEYLHLGYYFANERYHLPHFSKYFLENAKEELKHAQDLMQYQMTRGATLSLTNVAAPQNIKFNSSCEAIDHARKLELDVTNQIELIWRKADTCQDVHLMDHLETHFVTEQHESLKKLADLRGTLQRLGICGGSSNGACDRLAEFQFDKTVMKDLTSS